MNWFCHGLDEHLGYFPNKCFVYSRQTHVSLLQNVVYVQQSNAYIHDKSQKEDPVQMLSRVWISCSLELEVWSEFELI